MAHCESIYSLSRVGLPGLGETGPTCSSDERRHVHEFSPRQWCLLRPSHSVDLMCAIVVEVCDPSDEINSLVRPRPPFAAQAHQPLGMLRVNGEPRLAIPRPDTLTDTPDSYAQVRQRRL